MIVVRFGFSRTAHQQAFIFFISFLIWVFRSGGGHGGIQRRTEVRIFCGGFWEVETHAMACALEKLSKKFSQMMKSVWYANLRKAACSLCGLCGLCGVYAVYAGAGLFI